MVSQAGRICYACLHNHPRLGPLCQLFQCRKSTATTSHSCTSPLCSARWCHGAYHASVHDVDVHNRSCEDTTAIIRDLLVHASSLHPILLGTLHTCGRMLRAGHCTGVLAVRWQALLAALHRIPRLEVGALGRGPLLG